MIQFCGKKQNADRLLKLKSTEIKVAFFFSFRARVPGSAGLHSAQPQQTKQCILQHCSKLDNPRVGFCFICLRFPLLAVYIKLRHVKDVFPSTYS